MYLDMSVTLNEFETELLNTTPLLAISAYDVHSAYRRRILNTFDQIPRIQHMNHTATPVFVFAHIVSPHQPFVFKANGKPIRANRPLSFDGYAEMEEGSAEFNLYAKLYCGQITFLNSKVISLIDCIQSQTGRLSIIIIQADHGDRATIELDSPDAACVRPTFAILNSYYWPDQDYSNLHDTISPVNSFRVVLNRFFGTDLPLLPDESYYYHKPRINQFIKAPQETSPIETKTIDDQ